MIEEIVKVAAVNGDEVTIESLRKSTCGGCSVKNGCGAGILADYFNRKEGVISMTLKNSIGAKRGDNIVIGIDESSVVQGSFIVYIVPLLFMFVFTVIGLLISKSAEIQSDWLQIVFGIFGLAVGLGCLYIYNSRKNGESRFTPKILRFAKDGEEQNCSQ
ncbi:MAG: hypothetical protein D6B27_10665 [Gammaproteobacteria bacterium]|nr:MAG: hypothetical protein D6B27_10665 [Gammaproteobacteria bacterium]